MDDPLQKYVGQWSSNELHLNYDSRHWLYHRCGSILLELLLMVFMIKLIEPSERRQNAFVFPNQI